MARECIAIFFLVTSPGTEVVDLLFFRFFGLRNWIPNLVVVLVGLASTWVVVSVSRKIIPTGRFLPLLPGFLYLTFGFYPRMTGEVHRWFSSAAVLAALAVVMEKRTPRRLILGGVLCGVASFFTQTQGVFAATAFVTFLIWEGHRERSGWKKVFQSSACLGFPWSSLRLPRSPISFGRLARAHFCTALSDSRSFIFHLIAKLIPCPRTCRRFRTSPCLTYRHSDTFGSFTAFCRSSTWHTWLGTVGGATKQKRASA